MHRGCEETVSLLLDNGADIDAKVNNYVRTLITTATTAATRSGFAPELHRTSDENETDRSIDLCIYPPISTVLQYGRTPLSLAVQNGAEKVVSLLFERGADVNAKTKVL